MSLAVSTMTTRCSRVAMAVAAGATPTKTATITANACPLEANAACAAVMSAMLVRQGDVTIVLLFGLGEAYALLRAGAYCQHKRKNKLTAFLLSILLGGLAVDRFYLGYIGVRRPLPPLPPFQHRSGEL